jgi:hypothetical protein
MNSLRTKRIVQIAPRALFLTASFLGTLATPQLPRVENLTLETRALTEPLEVTVQKIAAEAKELLWIGYRVDEATGGQTKWCENYHQDGNCDICRLEKENYGTNRTSRASGTVQLEGARQAVVLYRLEAKRVMRIRVVSEDCTLDAGGLTVIWLTGVKPAESVALLEGQVRGDHLLESGEHSLGHEAMAAIAVHADRAADLALVRFTAPGQPESLRKQAGFWLGVERGKAGLTALQSMAKGDPSPEVRAQVAFALSVSQEAGAADEMIRMAREDGSAHVRGQALFWLAQKAGKKVLGTISGAIENDPDTEVKKKAVFALTQLPKDEGVPKLIEVAATNRNREVRKQAMFWLGQSNDPRALEFFEKVLAQ